MNVASGLGALMLWVVPEISQAFDVGVDANYSLAMKVTGKSWQWDGKKEELFQGIARQGVRKFRVRLWTGDGGPNGKDYATEIVRQTRAAGLDPYLVIFLSDDWADLMKQPIPGCWKDLDLNARAEAVREYSRQMVTHFRAAGLQSHLYEIGNEIDYGVCGIYPGKSTKKNPASLRRKIWPEAAILLQASQAGVLAADPDARFLLHIAHWWDADFCIGFFQFMLSHKVRLDYAGLSYFPSANIGGSLEMAQFGEVVKQLHDAIGRPIIVPETAYPGTTDFKGQFSRWKNETPGYPLTPEGQQHWLADFLAFCAHEPAIDSVYYWSPEWFGDGMWTAFALFDPNGEARPAWKAFASGERGAPKKALYFEAHEGELIPVPIEEAKRQARPALEEEMRRAGRVNLDYIKAITARELIVDGYRVNLRASLMGNLDLSLDTATKSVDWKGMLAKVDASKEKVVLFTRAESEPFVTQVTADAKARGIEMVIHPIVEGKPLKFGFGQVESTEEELGAESSPVQND